jgi:hypothetical protein
MTTTAFTPAPGPETRFPLQRIMDLTRAGSLAQLADWLGVSADAVRQWAWRGLSSQQADSVATKLGYWPGSVWDNFDADVVPDDADFDGDFVALDVSENAGINRPQLNCCQVAPKPTRLKLPFVALRNDRSIETPDVSIAAHLVLASEMPIPRPNHSSMWPSLPRMAGASGRADAKEDLPAIQPLERPRVGGKSKFAAPRPNTRFRPGSGPGGAR